ncbi:uncharacterized protein LOC141686344 [Apium graveolens]|uniref:uncharacterized protein LOC141686344 n=1 Tax=Apium graveolens TaxID=4045 RepID=UPI003D79C834
MSEAEEIWINLPRSSDEYINGVKNFVKNAMAKYAFGAELKCPCGFEDDLSQMLNLTYTNREPNSDAWKFYRLIEDGKQPLYPGSKKISRLSFLVRLYHWKCLNGVTQTAFGEMLQLLKEAFPDIEIPTLFNSAKHRDTEEEHKNDTIPAKVMRYFHLKPKLQRMYMCKEFAKLMTWHVAWKKDGMLRHPADGVAWKTMDAKYPNFSSENRNIRLGIASDGFNPFGIMSGSHSTWPVIVVNYNLPPWLNMKPENLIMSTLIPGPNDPVNSIDVYLQPLVEELKELWDVGVNTFDTATNQNFVLRASVLWIISDFPGYAMLSGWSTKGYLACPICNYKILSTYLKHSRKAPAVLSGRMIKRLLDGYQNTFGKVKGKRKVSCDLNPWNKKSIFFQLPYWSENSIRHNLNVMHIEKNIYDSILGTLLNISGKTKDHVNARLDLQEMGDNESSSVNELGTRIHETSEYPILSGRNQKGKAYQLSDDVWTAAHILFNYNDKEVEALIEQHRSLFDVNAKLNKYKRARTHTDEVCEWFKTEIRKKLNVSREIASLAIGPKRVARRFRGYVVNGYRFHTKSRDKKCIIQNSGVYLTALTTSFASLKDQKPTTGEVTYYGSIEKIFEVDYWGCLNMVLFRCTWMGGDFMTFNLHHKGEFHKSKYAGGTVNTVKDFELDVFSYSELMEWVHQLGYKEIGGIYV